LCWSPSSANVPFQGGTLLIGLPIVRIPTTLDALGNTLDQIPLDPSMVGQTRYYQLIYRDNQHPDGTGWGMSNGVKVTFIP